MLTKPPCSETDQRVQNGISYELGGVAGKKYRYRVALLQGCFGD